MKAATQTQTVFDHEHYRNLIETRGATIREVLARLQPVLGFKTALDAGCGLGFFAEVLRQAGLAVQAFDGRTENVEEAKQRFPEIPFQQGDIQDPGIALLGMFDFVLCFGLLYHLENPFAAIRNLRALTGKALLLESMCLPDERPWMLLREEPNLQDQSLTDVAFYASEGCLAKMMYRAGFSFVYRLEKLPEHDDFKETPEHLRRRTVLLGTRELVSLPGFTHLIEPTETMDPWKRDSAHGGGIHERVRNFVRKPIYHKYLAVARRTRRIVRGMPVLLRLPFGVWWIAKRSRLDEYLLLDHFENAEVKFVQRFLTQGMTFVDAGAHHGLYTLLASKIVGPTGRVIAFEPSPRERKRLNQHLELNRLRGVRVEPYALGAQSGEAELFLADGVEDWCNSLRRPQESSGATVRVPVKCLDDALGEAKLGRIDFVKLDVEGAELDTLKGASILLKSAPRPIFLVEVYDIRTQPFGYDAREIVKFLADVDFDWFSLNADGMLVKIAQDLARYDTNLVAVPMERADEIRRLLG